MRTSILVVVLASGCFSASESSKPDAPSNDDDAAVPTDGSVDANPSAPTCTIGMPASGSSTAYDVAVRFEATATDPEDGALTGASIVWRSNLQTAPLGSGAMINVTLPPGDNVVTCTATDSTNLDGTATVMVRSRSPFAQINHPGDNEPPRSSANPVQFVGVARDKEDGNLTGASLVWTSNLDGMIGTGVMFNKMVSAGTHTITLTATDSASNADVVTITLVMN